MQIPRARGRKKEGKRSGHLGRLDRLKYLLGSILSGPTLLQLRILKPRFAVCRFPGQGEGKRKEKDQVITGVSTGSNICLDPFCPVPRSCNSASSSRYWYRRLAISTPVQPLSSKWVLWAVVPGALAERVTGRKHLNQERMENRFYCGGNGRQIGR